MGQYWMVFFFLRVFLPIIIWYFNFSNMFSPSEHAFYFYNSSIIVQYSIYMQNFTGLLKIWTHIDHEQPFEQWFLGPAFQLCWRIFSLSAELPLQNLFCSMILPFMAKFTVSSLRFNRNGRPLLLHLCHLVFTFIFKYSINQHKLLKKFDKKPVTISNLVSDGFFRRSNLVFVNYLSLRQCSFASQKGVQVS